MKKLAIIPLVLFVGLLVNAQKRETRSLSSFSEISVHEAVDVFIIYGDKEEARIESFGIELKEVLTEVTGGELKIHLEGNRHRNINVTVWVTYKFLSAISVSSASSLTGKEEVNAHGDFKIRVSSAGDLRLDLIADDIDVEVSSAGNLELTASGDELDIKVSSAGDAKLEVDVSSIDGGVSSAGDVKIKGTVKNQEITVSSSGSYGGYDLTSEEVDVRASSGGSAKFNVSARLDARASSGGYVRYKGTPEKVQIRSSSGGTVKKY